MRGSVSGDVISDTTPQYDGLDRLENDEQVEADREILDVEQVELQLLHRVLDAGAVGVAHLRPSGQARLDDMALAVERNLHLEVLDELGTLRAGSDQAHVAAQHVPQLRQLVEARPPHEAAQRR